MKAGKKSFGVCDAVSVRRNAARAVIRAEQVEKQGIKGGSDENYQGTERTSH